MKSSIFALLLALMPAQQMESVNAWLSKNLGRPYVWGATGYKSYDCSGVIWRMLSDHGVFMSAPRRASSFSHSRSSRPTKNLRTER